MNGKAHSVIGAGVGFLVAHTIGADTGTTIVLTGAGAISGLVPDLDTHGKLANQITFSNNIAKSLLILTGLLLLVFSYLIGDGSDKWIGITLGAISLIAAFKWSQKIMLFTTGVTVISIGYFFSVTWALLIGIYIVVASLLPHRSYTHSALGILFFSTIAYLFSQQVQIEGMFATLTLGYLSHLLADSRFIPGNKQGVKLLMPLSSKQF